MAVRVLPHSITSKRGCDGFNHIRHTLTNQRCLDNIVSVHKLKHFPPCPRISYLLLTKIDGINAPADPARRGAHGDLRHIVKKVIDWNSKNLAHVPQAQHAHTVDTTLILLNLLEGEFQSTTQLFLTRSQQCSAQADPFPDMHIDGIVVGKPQISLNLIILSHDFILLLYAAILPKVAPKNIQIPLSSIILLAFTFWACR